MFRQIFAGVKTETRRIIKQQPGWHHWEQQPGYKFKYDLKQTGDGLCVRFSHQLGCKEDDVLWIKCPFGQPGDILWVKETFSKLYSMGIHSRYIYKSNIFDEQAAKEIKWKSSLFMPRAAARLFLEIQQIYVERVQDISFESIKAEGVGDKEEWIKLWNSIHGHPKPIKRDGEIIAYESYPWEDIQETREHKGKPWRVYGNPWVWVVKFQKK